VAQIRQVFGAGADDLLDTSNGAVRLDLWQANHLTLTMAGVEHIEVAGLCTACHPQDWFSHRAEAGKTGRFGALLALPT
jgi:copper oxidase (laccase) domain-containing protein